MYKKIYFNKNTYAILSLWLKMTALIAFPLEHKLNHKQSLELYPEVMLARLDLHIWQVVLKIGALNLAEINTQRLKLIKIDGYAFAVTCALNGCRVDLMTTQLFFNNFHLVLMEVKYLGVPFLMYARK